MNRLQSGIQLLQAGNLDSAENIFRALLSKNSHDVHALHFLGVVFCLKGNLDEGVALIERSISLDSSRFSPYLNMGRFLLGANQLDRSVAALQQAVQRDESSFEAWSLLAQSSFFAGSIDAAVMAAKKAAEINPGNAEIFFSLGVYSSQDSKDQAIEFYRHALSIDPSCIKSRVNLGNCLMDCQRIEESISAFDNALKTDPSCFQALMGLSRAYGGLSKWWDSLDIAKKAFISNPSSHDAAFWVGFSLHKLDRKQEAVNAYRIALDISPVAAQTHLHLASALEGLGDYKNAISHYKIATTIDQTLSLAFIYWGALLQKGGDLSLAIDKYRRAVDSDPLSVDAYAGLGDVLREKGEVDEAIVSYRKAIELDPNCVAAYWNLGWLLKDSGKIDEARRIAKTLRQIKPLEKENLITFQDKTLVFDWHHRRALSLLWAVEVSAALSRAESSSLLAAVRQADNICFPASFLVDEFSCEDEKYLYKNGFLVDEGMVSPYLCTQLIDQFSHDLLMTHELIKSVLDNGILRSALEKVFLHTGLPHLIWNCEYFYKGPDDESVSDAWHYDNHYNDWSPKLMIYLNSQLDEGGATHFVDAALSRQISEKSDYMGFVSQRESYASLAKGLVDDLIVDPVTLDPDYYTFSPHQAGSGVWFCPSRVLHRGLSPKKGLRHVLSLSLTPLPVKCGWNVDHCVDTSVEILKDKVNKGMQATDDIPYWIST